jgi:hypothetical protein
VGDYSMKKTIQILVIIICVLVICTSYYSGAQSTSLAKIVKVGHDIIHSSSVTDIANYWAILVCGSNDFYAGFETDIRDMYQLLKNELKYDDDHVYYVAPRNWNGAKHYYSLSKNNIKKAIQDVAGRSTNKDSVLFLYTGHGNFNDKTGEYSIDPGIIPDELDSWLDSFDSVYEEPQKWKCQQMIIIIQSCFSGGFKEKLVFHEGFPTSLIHRDRILITSTDKYTKSWEDMSGYADPVGGATWDPNAPDDDGNPNNPSNGNWDGSEFSSGFRMAFRDVDNDGYLEADDQPYINKQGKSPDLTPPSGNKDGKVSVKEAFDFSKFEDCYSVYWKSFVQAKGWKPEYPEMWDPVSWGDPNGIDPSKTFIYSTNRAPNKPNRPSGPASGKVGEPYAYSSSTTDPDGDQVYYFFDWGDGTNSGWLGPYDSGSIVEASHIWNEEGSFEIKVKAKDTSGLESEWSDPLVVSMPKSYSAIFAVFEKIIGNTIFKFFNKMAVPIPF